GCITFEGSDGAKVMTSADLRYRVSANSGTEDGTEPEPGTPAWQQLVDAVHTDAAAAEQAKTDAQTAAQQAGASAKKAGQALSDTITAKEDALKAIGDKQATATQAVDTARDKALKQVEASTEAAQTAASEAATSAGSASQSAAKSSAAASNANASAENAARAQVTASQLAGQAADSASEAQNSATKAAASQQAAESNAAAAQGSATKADASASTAVQGQQRAEAAATRAETAQQQTESASTDALDKISSAKTDALKALDTKQTSATTAVESAKGKALDAVTDAQDTATQAVQAEQASATTAVKKAGAEVLTSIPEDYQTTVQKVKELDAQKVETDEAISAVKARQNIIVGSEIGNPISVDDAFPAPLCGLTVYGRSTQDGTPTPDAPVPIVSAGDGGSVVVKVTGKNRMPPNLEYQEFVECFVKKNTPITLVFKGDLVSQGGNILFFDENNNQYWFGIDAGKAEHHITYPVDVTKFQYLLSNMASENVCLTWNASSPDYEPYREQLLTLPTPTGLPGIPVTSGGNYTDSTGRQWVCDEVDLTRGVRVQRVNAVDLSTCKITGTTELAVTKRLSIMLPIRGRDYKTEALCNKLRFFVSFTQDSPHFYVDTANAQVFIPIGAKNPEEGEYILFYALATPIETPLTPDEIAAYKALTTYGPDTVVQAGDGAGVKLEYQRDVNIAIKKLEDAVASMT
ncbi:MAG: hypothetical protein KH132_13150, partial [Faecalibacterium prausnitzii]|nr:hypothetical protein [Faecalibacterium prausnitzii]